MPKYEQKKLEIKNPNFVLMSENFVSGNFIGQLYVNTNNIADTLFIIKKILNNLKSETIGVEVTPIEAGQNQVTFTCDGNPSTCKGTCTYDSKSNIIGCRINILN